MNAGNDHLPTRTRCTSNPPPALFPNKLLQDMAPKSFRAPPFCYSLQLILGHICLFLVCVSWCTQRITCRILFVNPSAGMERNIYLHARWQFPQQVKTWGIIRCGKMMLWKHWRRRKNREKQIKSRVKLRKQGKTDKSRVKESKKGGRREDHPVVGWGETAFYGVTATQEGGHRALGGYLLFGGVNVAPWAKSNTKWSLRALCLLSARL